MGPHKADDATPRFPVKAHVPHEEPRALKAEAPCPSSARSMAPSRTASGMRHQTRRSLGLRSASASSPPAPYRSYRALRDDAGTSIEQIERRVGFELLSHSRRAHGLSAFRDASDAIPCTPPRSFKFFLRPRLHWARRRIQ